MKKHFITTLFLVFFTLPFCASAQKTDSITIELAKYEKFRIPLDYCPGAGSFWTISDTTDKAVISLIEKTTKLKEGNLPIGGTYTDILVFQAMALGKKTITIVIKHLDEILETKVLIFKVT
jgi:predicted secreted protein